MTTRAQRYSLALLLIYRYEVSMRNTFLWALILLSPISVAKDYLLGVGDQISISVYDEPDLNTNAKIDESGFVSFPFLEDIQAIGLTTKRLEKRVHEGLLGDYLINPQVTVSITEYRPFFIHGEVNRPGSYPYQDDLTLDKAIAIAGGLAARASSSNWTITRKEKEKSITKDADVSTRINPDDIIKIEQSFF